VREASDRARTADVGAGSTIERQGIAGPLAGVAETT